MAATKKRQRTPKQTAERKRKNATTSPAVAKKSKTTATQKQSVGDLVVGRIDLSKSLKPPSLTVRIGEQSSGRICVTHIEDEDSWSEDALSKFGNNKFVKCRVLKSGSDAKSSHIELSLRSSLTDSALSGKALRSALEDELTNATALPKVGELVKGFVANVSKAGCFVRLTRKVTGRVVLKDLADHYVKDVNKAFPMGKLVAGRVLNVNEKKGLVDLSLKASVVIGESSTKWTWDTIAMGAKITGRVRKIEKYGLFIDLDESARLSGLCHISETSDEHVKDIAQEYSPGDRVKVLVINVDKEKKRISLGMKPSYFEDDEDDQDDEQGDSASEAGDDSDIGQGMDQDSDSEDVVDGDSEDEDENGDINMLEPVSESDSEDEDSIEKLVKQVKGNGDDSDEESADSEEDGDESDVEDKDNEQSGGAPSLQQALALLKPKKSGNDSDSEADSSDDEDDEGSSQGKKSHHKSSKEREKLRKRREAETQEKENKMLEDDDTPQTSEDFERALLTAPNSSFLWINYMALRVSETDIPRARAVAERALRSIHFRQEGEKLNIWVALLNLEHKYGDEDSLQAVFKRMVQHMEPKVAFLKLAELHAKEDEIEKADAAYRMAIKKTKGESKVVYLEFVKYKFEINDAAGARELLKEALKRLSGKDKYIDMAVKFARIEYSHENGDAERARTLCEGLVDNYPKRTDIWHQYVDMEIKFGSAEKARRVFERVTTLKVSAKKMKTFFKKWLAFEAENGSEDDVEHVKTKAREYVEAVNA